ncbi:uncharacterized protein TrAFT101_003045 [Trichoderma asperellum]|uniref:uncharacterized protein n=1 Tax=Trichoderma asperellum TaxID=101201 RepID=UPI00331E97B2|nr:hypothetical protein TrAFT101_003045 [Trichoderma asperellum]
MLITATSLVASADRDLGQANAHFIQTPVGRATAYASNYIRRFVLCCAGQPRGQLQHSAELSMPFPSLSPNETPARQI